MTIAPVQLMLNLTLTLNPNPYATLNQTPNDNPRSYSLSPEISSQGQMMITDYDLLGQQVLYKLLFSRIL